MPKRIFLLCFVIVFASLSTAAQNEESKKTEAYVFAEFGKISLKLRRAKIKEYHETLKKFNGVDGVVINYGSKQDVVLRRKALAEDFVWCDAFNGVRLTFVDGPRQLRIRTVLWVVPIGADLPKP